VAQFSVGANIESPGLTSALAIGEHAVAGLKNTL
jgi:hypothetical protein